MKGRQHMSDEMIFEQDVKRNPAVCALYAVLRYQQYFNDDAKAILEALRCYILDGMPMPKDKGERMTLERRLNKLGEAGRDLAYDYRRQSEEGMQPDDETPRYYALSMLMMSLRGLASMAWCYALARTLPDRAETAYDNVEFAAKACWSFLGFRDSDTEVADVTEDERMFRNEVRLIPPAPVTRAGLEAALTGADEAQARVLRVLLTPVGQT